MEIDFTFINIIIKKRIIRFLNKGLSELVFEGLGVNEGFCCYFRGIYLVSAINRIKVYFTLIQILYTLFKLFQFVDLTVLYSLTLYHTLLRFL